MSSSITLPPPYPVKVHSYLPLSSSTSSPAHPLQAYEHLPDYDAQASPPSTQPPPNVLVFIGGLGDGPHTIPYVRHLATYLSSSSNNNNNTPATASGSPAPRYRVFEARLTSAFSAFGYGSLAQDARELAALVRHLRGPLVGARRVVLMGHSTGCQDCLEGDDDYFSSDLPDEKLESVWGRLEQPVLILPSEKDEWVPADTDVMGLVNRWKSFCKPGIASDLSGLIPGANHRVDNPAGQEWLADRVARFLAELEK
ncbi:80a9b6ba-82a8-4414-ab4e-adc9996cb143 [Thermothielavioides terrestris]|uniref:80a9b6ba-82a8-4414-ab4e-adc9996cb143 n=1 Tax=Thermothielavioides terrestris TaxID=2587410 RepID=A0A3S4AP45_9PEZI|nr:80a9b6ba-82a8-4414-ab4e-adc9996cb143 [Thermothielavioides terrestris]